ncbi:hypothetical protein A3A38_04865 [Candidatus Kaiserbacteria bacterium RIFCSPLOWO2_01_FULL_53_17]|uniref:Endonuclease/exonuclease/phosphatase domain-containing protein n=1 Tax=Candidatus Kaiserbacteria bacterium RIFCSPLOWO2_01_FULL_53_17 TaxID=1798511 RepID=A0A1F6EIF7_9BACT|nr:MAG: hypothetical protein A3A38_04865 [Candidatus Kaiserbacteria bacterium RIFCSPLOWO2_01_FULL_53_17]
MAIKLISVNVERANHLDRVLPFLARESPHVVCIQEICEPDVPRFAKTLGAAQHAFVPMTREFAEGGHHIIGLGIFSQLPLENVQTHYYHTISESLPDSSHYEPTTYNNPHRLVLSSEVTHEDVRYRFATTHFTWSLHGQATDLQRTSMQRLLHILDGLKDFILCGDFNAPRGGEIFDTFAARYTDNIPREYTTSIDGTLHRAGSLPYMVDGLFTTPEYRATDVRLVSGVSDHCAIVATITGATSQ